MPSDETPQPVTAPPATPAEDALQLPPEQKAQFDAAQKQLKTIMNATEMAHKEFLGQTTFGVLTVIWPFIFPPVTASVLIMGAWMTVGGLVEGFGEKHIKRMSAKIFALLTVNQILLGLMFSVIGAWWVIEVHNGWDNKDVIDTAKYFKPVVWIYQLVGQTVPKEEITSWAKWALYLTYGSVVVFGFGWQGFVAGYYVYRGRQMAKYLKSTPKWILQKQRTALFGQ